MKTLILCTLLTLCAGCSSISGTRETKDGQRLTIRTLRFAWQSEAIKFSTKSPDGFVVTLSVGRSASDPETAKAIASGIAEGLAKGIKGTP